MKMDKNCVGVSQTVRMPMTKQDVADITNLCEELIERIQSGSAGWDSIFAKQTAGDLMDVIIDIKVDIAEWGEKEAVLMHDDGFCDPIKLGEDDGRPE